MNRAHGGNLSFHALSRAFAVGLLIIGGWAASDAPLARAQEINHRTKSKVIPNYPALARQMKLTGVVRVMVTVYPNGSIKETKLLGGHPVLATATLEAIRKWRFEAGPEESTGIVEFRFDPSR
jgi:TonB family protein